MNREVRTGTFMPDCPEARPSDGVPFVQWSTPHSNNGGLNTGTLESLLYRSKANHKVVKTCALSRMLVALLHAGRYLYSAFP